MISCSASPCLVLGIMLSRRGNLREEGVRKVASLSFLPLSGKMARPGHLRAGPGPKGQHSTLLLFFSFSSSSSLYQYLQAYMERTNERALASELVSTSNTSKYSTVQAMEKDSFTIYGGTWL